MSAVKLEPLPEAPPEELLGSLTTYSSVHAGGEAGGPAVRTSARVIKKLRLDSSDQRERKDSAKLDIEKSEKEYSVTSTSVLLPLKNVIKPRMPKAIWSSTEKDLFFEALNEHGKDFDSITTYICSKMKRKGITNATTKTKHQVSQFYYRTWAKVSKHVKFSDNVTKLVQELYALINYGEMRKRLELGVASRTASRLPELVGKGVVAVRERGKTLRVRTPVCRALRRLNQLEEWDEHLRLPNRVMVALKPRDSEAWARVQSAAHNPRALAPAAPSMRLFALLLVLQRRWQPWDHDKDNFSSSLRKKKSFDSLNSLNQQIQMLLNPNMAANSALSLQIQNMPTLPKNMRAGLQELSKLNKVTSNTTNKSTANVENSESTQKKDSPKINGHSSLSSRQEDCSMSIDKVWLNPDSSVRMEDLCDEDPLKLEAAEEIQSSPSVQADSTSNVKVPEPAASVDQRLQGPEDNGGKKDEEVPETRPVVNSAGGNLVLHVGPKPGIDLNFPTININEHITSQRLSLAAYQERIGNIIKAFQSEAGFKGGGSRFKKRQRKDSGDNTTNKASKVDDNCDVYMKEVLDIDETANDGMDMVTFTDVKNSATDGAAFEEDKDFLSEMEDEDKDDKEEKDDKDNNDTDGESDVPKAINDEKNTPTDKVPNLKVKLRDRSKKDKSSVPGSIMDSPEEPPRVSAATSTITKSWNRDIVLQQIKKGWSIYDSGDLTIGDMYLMFGSESKLELHYWWAQATAPIPPVALQRMQQVSTEQQQQQSADGAAGGGKEDGARRTMTAEEILMSPTHGDSNDEEKREMMSPDHKTIPHVPEDPSTSSSFPLVSKIINFPCQTGNTNGNGNTHQSPGSDGADGGYCPAVVPQRERVVTLSGRLKKLLSIAKMYDRRKKPGCTCGHFCGGSRGKRNTVRDDMFTLPTPKPVQTPLAPLAPLAAPELPRAPAKEVFQLPQRPEVAIWPQPPRPGLKTVADLELDKLPRWTRRGKTNKPPPRKQEPFSLHRCAPILPRGYVLTPGGVSSCGSPVVVASPASIVTSSSVELLKPAPKPPARPVAIAPAPLLRVLPAVRPWPGVPVPKIDRSVAFRPPSSFKIEPPSPAPSPALSCNSDASEVSKPPLSVAGHSTDQVANFPPSSSDPWTHLGSVKSEAGSVKSEKKDATPNLANLLDISLPSNIGDDYSIGEPLKHQHNGGTIKHDNFSAGDLPGPSSQVLKELLVPLANWKKGRIKRIDFTPYAESLGLLPAESMSMSPSRLLKEDQWLESEVHNFSLSSFLGHLEAGRSKGPESVKGEETSVDGHHLHSLMGETSIDYMAKFEDLAARVGAETTK